MRVHSPRIDHRTQRRVAELSEQRFPLATTETEALALAEEAGEVARAVLKRWHGVRGSREAWTAALRQEIAQVVVVALRLAALERFDLAEAVNAEVEAWAARDPNHDPVQTKAAKEVA